MTMNDDERKFLSDQIAEKFAWFNRGSRNWSFVFNWSLAASALLSAAAAIVLKITLLQEYIGADGAKDGLQSISNLESDIYWQWLIDRDVVGMELRAQAPVRSRRPHADRQYAATARRG